MAQCVGIRVVSFNIGLEQSMLESTRRWEGQHVIKFRDVLSSLGHAAHIDFVFCSEVGGKRKGFRDTNVDFQRVVQEALPGATCSSSGAYLNIRTSRNKPLPLRSQAPGPPRRAIPRMCTGRPST